MPHAPHKITGVCSAVDLFLQGMVKRLHLAPMRYKVDSRPCFWRPKFPRSAACFVIVDGSCFLQARTAHPLPSVGSPSQATMSLLPFCSAHEISARFSHVKALSKHKSTAFAHRMDIEDYMGAILRRSLEEHDREESRRFALAVQDRSIQATLEASRAEHAVLVARQKQAEDELKMVLAMSLAEDNRFGFLRMFVYLTLFSVGSAKQTRVALSYFPRPRGRALQSQKTRVLRRK
jgi:hypothetical protein